MNAINVSEIPSLHDLLSELRDDYHRTLKADAERRREQFERDVRVLEQNRQVLPLLVDIAGDKVRYSVAAWSMGTITVDLGQKPTKKKELEVFNQVLVALREVLGNLKDRGKDLSDYRKKLIRVELSSEDYPGVLVVFRTKLSADARCKIVRKKHRYTSHSLECSTGL